MSNRPRRQKVLLASAIFSVTGTVATALLLWSAGRGRPAPGPVGGPAPHLHEVRFDAGNRARTGTLALPLTPGPHPAVLMLGGAGQADHTFPALAQHLARHGFACLFWEHPDDDTTPAPDNAAAALAALRFLQGRPEVRKDRVGLWGYGRGAVVAPLAATLAADAAFLVAVSGCQLPAWQQEPHRVTAELRADGFVSAVVNEATEYAKVRIGFLRGDSLFEELDETQRGIMGRPWFSYVGYTDRKRFEAARATVNFDPAPAWEKVHCPVLAVFGANDVTGPIESSASVIRTGLEKAGNTDLTVKVFQRADHRLIVSETGGRKEADARAKERSPSADPDFVPGYLDTATAWLVAHCGPKR